VRLVFAGTPDFSVSALDALHDAGHPIVGVYTQPDRPAGRGQKLTPSPVSQRADVLGLPLFKPEKLRGNESALSELRALAPDVMVVVAYGLILPQAVLDIPAHGCLNIHASLLPRWRGAAPIQRALLAGDTQTGITIMRMDAGLDTGPMLLREALPIGDEMHAGSLHDQLAAMGARLIVEALARLDRGELPDIPQPANGASYASKIEKSEAKIDWSRPALEIARAVRAFNPAPVAWTELDGERLRIWEARPLDLPVSVRPGAILDSSRNGIVVATGQGALSVQCLQWPGGKPQTAALAAQARPLAGRQFS
jgi:methionyl-tRNA formyltransferase